jgi:hypothetical protein
MSVVRSAAESLIAERIQVTMPNGHSFQTNYGPLSIPLSIPLTWCWPRVASRALGPCSRRSLSPSNLIMNLLLVPFFGMTGAAIGTACATISAAILTVAMMRRYLGVYA